MKNLVLRFALIGVFALSLAACETAATGSKFKQTGSAGGGTIYIYAPGGFGGYGASPTIKVNDKSIGKLHARGFLAYKVSPGTYAVKVEALSVMPLSILFGGNKKSVTIKRGGSAYLKIYREIAAINGIQNTTVTKIKVVENSVGRREIQSTRSSN